MPFSAMLMTRSAVVMNNLTSHPSGLKMMMILSMRLSMRMTPTVLMTMIVTFSTVIRFLTVKTPLKWM